MGDSDAIPEGVRGPRGYFNQRLGTAGVLTRAALSQMGDIVRWPRPCPEFSEVESITNGFLLRYWESAMIEKATVSSEALCNVTYVHISGFSSACTTYTLK
jgi:hypothetical protein